MIVLSQHDEEQLLSVISDRSVWGYRDKAMIRFALATGLRVAELVGLRVRHVCQQRPDGSGPMVRETLALPAQLAKGGRPRDVHLNEKARQAVVHIVTFNDRRGFAVGPEAPLFPNRYHRAMSTRAVRHMMQKYREQADLDVKATPHTLRHTYTTKLVGAGVSTVCVQHMLGHRRLASTQRYAHPTPDQLKEAANRI